MDSGKRYYWLKLYDDFFSSVRIKKLRKIAGGDTYLAIYLKMQLLAMKNDGILKWSGIEDDFASELALDLDEEPENVKVTMSYLLSCGLAETNDSISYFFPFAVSNVGSEGSSAKRVREYRERLKELPCNIDVTQVKQIGNGEIRDKRQEIEIEKDITVSNDTVCWTKNVQRVLDAWNSLGLNKIQRISKDTNRGKMLNARLKEYGTDTVVNAIERIKKSSFLKGQNRNGWTIVFDWFIKPNNFIKVMEGNYDDNTGSTQPPLNPNKNQVQTDYGSPEDFYK